MKLKELGLNSSNFMEMNIPKQEPNMITKRFHPDHSAEHLESIPEIQHRPKSESFWLDLCCIIPLRRCPT